ncbi:MAG TPA: alpha/beta fold hydrolase [Solirubrobacteraceae bacterium]|nr:alpha/beta fold hydrolase [Solirubrobacteraceae bacterium]
MGDRRVLLHHRIDHTGGPHAHRLVLVHGVGDELGGWDRVVQRLPPGFDVLRYDLRGHGRSQRPPGPYRLEDFVADHLQLVAELGFTPHTLVGFSLGGMIAQAVALGAPEAVSRLVILSAVAGRTEDERARVAERLETLRREGPAGIAAVSAQRWYTEDFMRREPETVSARLRRLAANDPDAYLAAYEVLATNDLLARLPGIGCPTLIMTGEHDVGSPPRMALAMHESIAGSELEIVPGIRHELLVEVPDLVADRIARFATAAMAVPGGVFSHAEDDA